MKVKKFVHLYTGDGKGKTTAAIGVALRACSYGKKVFIFQFLKNGSSGEIEFLKKHCKTAKIFVENIDSFFSEKTKDEHKREAQKLFNLLKRTLDKELPELLILDEINIALSYGLIDKDDFLSFLKKFRGKCEIILTGRYAPEELYSISDLITEFIEVKHYFKEGIKAREGIEY